VDGRVHCGAFDLIIFEIQIVDNEIDSIFVFYLYNCFGAYSLMKFLFSAFMLLALNATAQNSCATAYPVCDGSTYPNAVGIGNVGMTGCLFVTVNPTYFIIKIGNGGHVLLDVLQSSGNTNADDLDVDKAVWGPFSSPENACAAIAAGASPTDNCEDLLSSPIHFYNAQAGNYYVFLVTNYANQQGNIHFHVEETSTGSLDCGILQIAQPEIGAVSLFPNPASKIFEVRLGNADETVRNIALYNTLGQKVLEAANFDHSQATVDVSNLDDGLYQVEITTSDERRRVAKLVVQ
jgi:hypothetical protein